MVSVIVVYVYNARKAILISAIEINEIHDKITGKNNIITHKIHRQNLTLRFYRKSRKL